FELNQHLPSVLLLTCPNRLKVDVPTRNELLDGDFIPKHAWDMIKETFVKKFGCHVTLTHLISKLCFYKNIYLISKDLQDNVGFTWDDEKSTFVGNDIMWDAYSETNSEFKKYIDKPFPYKRQLDILCGKTTVRGSHFMGSTQEVDVEARRSFEDDDSVDREQFNAMGLESIQFYSIDGDNFNPFDFPSSSQANPPSQSIGDKTPINIHPVEDEATSPTRRRNDHASTCSRKRKSKKSFDPNLLSQHCMMNNERINMVRALFPSSSSTSSTPQEQYTMRECVVRMKSLPGYNQQLLFLASTLFEKPEKRAWFMALDDDDALAWIVNATS
ncbi:hypothetical protein Taro_015723, partial [Colocasia esculenta]|nr:hypothetical protein [Colocasia esculenta]